MLWLCLLNSLPAISPVRKFASLSFCQLESESLKLLGKENFRPSTLVIALTDKHNTALCATTFQCPSHFVFVQMATTLSTKAIVTKKQQHRSLKSQPHFRWFLTLYWLLSGHIVIQPRDKASTYTQSQTKAHTGTFPAEKFRQPVKTDLLVSC